MKGLAPQLIAAALAVLPFGGATPGNEHVLHEKRGELTDPRWITGDRVSADSIVPLRIGLAQQNLHTGYDRLMIVSHPDSPNYGQHLSAEEVHEIFQPAVESVAAVKAWLASSGIDENEIVHSENKGWLAIDLPAADYERLFQASLYEHTHSETGTLRIGCEEYHLPKNVQQHVDYIVPGVKRSAPLIKRQVELSAVSSDTLSRQWHSRRPQSWPVSWTVSNSPQDSWQPPRGAAQLPPDLRDCGRNITPTCIKALYGIPKPSHTDPLNSVGLYESQDTYSQADLNLFFAKYAPYIPKGTHPKPAFIDGGEAPVAQDSPYNGGESDTDIDVILSLVYPQTITLYQTDDIQQALTVAGFFNTFLDALDGSYCNYSAYGITGDSPGIDPQYPDPAPGGYKGKLQCGIYKPTRVISLSYGLAEADLPPSYSRRQCSEWMKLGLQGTTIVSSTGDFGVSSSPGDGSYTGCLSGFGQNQTIYSPDFLSGCPYLTAVGATQLNANETIYDPESAMQQNLEYVNPGAPGLNLFATAGGFSNYFTTPDYQKQAVANYFAKHDPGHPYYVANYNATNVGVHGGIYNRHGRGYPDVSANGAFLTVFVNGTEKQLFGTSISAPIWAGVITLINEQRTAAGKGPVGFINPVLYSNPWVLKDIVNGSNPNCGSSGFKAVPGWDPITGLGTPKYEALLDLFMKLK